jgi:hypothetical protein
VTEAVDGPCSFASELSCHRVTFELLEGPDQGTITTQEFELLSSAPHFQPGDRVVLNVIPNADPLFRYQYADRDDDIFSGS